MSRNIKVYTGRCLTVVFDISKNRENVRFNLIHALTRLDHDTKKGNAPSKSEKIKGRGAAG